MLDKENYQSGEEGAVVLDEMAERELAHLQKAAEIEEEIEGIEDSAITDIGALSKHHNYLRMKFDWYSAWHQNRRAERIHYLLLIIFCLLVLTVFYFKR